MPREDLSGQLLAPALADLVRRLAAEAAHLSYSFFADLMGDPP